MRGRSRLFRAWAPPVLVAAAIFLLSSVPGSSYPRHSELFSGAAHAAEFALLAYFLARALGLTLPGHPVLLPVAISAAFCVIYGLADEVHQLFVPQRVFDPVDLLCDALGAATGVAVWARGRLRAGRGGSG